MRIIQTDQILPSQLSAFEKELVYNGLDCCITAEVLNVLRPQLDNLTAGTYAFSRALQGPVLEMRLRGIRINQARKEAVISDYRDKISTLESNLERLVCDGLGFYGFNWRSNTNLKELFYDRLGIPPIIKQGRPTVDRNALERMEQYSIARPIISHLEAMRELGKKISMLQTEIDPDGRMRTSYNIAGTTTGRFSSAFSEFGTGTNLQNVEEILRTVFEADPGKKLGYFDAKQGESRAVGAIEWNLFKDGKYLDTCESGDLHTNTAKLCWPDLAWTGELVADQALAELNYYRHYSRRFMCKKIGHGSNYGGKPHTLAKQAKVPIKMIEEFQPKYFTAFPTHLRWHACVQKQLLEFGYLISLTDRKRYFWGRRNDNSTLREAIAYDPQGSLSDIVNNGMLNVWRARDCELLLQTHDGILVQYPEEKEDEVIPRILNQLNYPITLSHNRTLVIPYDSKTGWNWGKYSKNNPEGLKSYEPGDKRKRVKAVSILDRKFY